MRPVIQAAAGWICIAILTTGAVSCVKKPDPKAAAAHHQNMIEAAVWGMPIVSFDAMRQAYFRDGQAQYNDIIYYSKPADSKLQITTPNASSRYVYFHFNLKNGPVVLEIPPAAGAGLFGSVLDAWQVPLVDVGPAGSDRGKGGVYVLLPPGYRGEMPEKSIPVPFRTVNGYGVLRAIPEDNGGEAIARALALVHQLKLYPLSQATEPPDQKFIDMSEKLFDGIVRFDETFYTSLARMIDEEPVLPRDQAMMEKLRTIGIVKGTTYQQGAAARESLHTAADEVHTFFMNQATAEGAPYWAGGNWRSASAAGAGTGFTFEENGKLNEEARGVFYFLACAPPAKLGKATMYLCAYVDSAGQPLLGDSTYTLRVPRRVPAKQFWAVTVYDAETAAFLKDSPRVEINSYQDLQMNPDGSVDLYFGPLPPQDKASNWVSTSSGKWFAFFRFYGPDTAILNRTWRLPDIIKVPPPASPTTPGPPTS
ncbi:MAG TPA: DUF1214 domain-containing protein [Gemmatimonadales bacterium]|nr:DUF1214 domain-containing protein [Gemmatimonadales bacterium]